MSKRTGKGRSQEEAPGTALDRIDPPPRQDGEGTGQGRVAEDAATKHTTPGRATASKRRTKRMASVPYTPTGRDPRTDAEIDEEDSTLVSSLLELRREIEGLQREASRILARMARNLETIRGRKRSTNGGTKGEGH